MNRFSKLAMVAAALPVFAIAAPAIADSPGQLEGGSIIYNVKNVTKGGSFAPSANASACNELEYTIRLHNISFGGLTNVHVQVNLPSGSSTVNTSTMTATTNLGGTSGASANATVNIDSAQTVSYENGTTVLYDSKGNVIKTLPDTITTSGVDIGGLNGSTTEFVNYKAKTSCPTTPPVTPPTTPPAKTLPNTGAGDVLGIFTGASAAGGVGHYIVARRKRGL